jgi:lysophospholipid acyltransferase (LPLAT)-like uncharacterized protein
VSWNNRPRWIRDLERKSAPYLILFGARWLIRTYRVQSVIGQNDFDRVLADRVTLLPCFWHTQIVGCAWFLIESRRRGLRLGFLISPSKDGEIGAKLFDLLKVPVIRGSSSHTGAKSLRDLYLAIKREGLSVATPPDGPLGPPGVFKPGWVNLARLTGAPMLPIAYAADRFWTLNTWDRLMIPKPFARIALALGDPVYAGPELDNIGLERLQERMEDELNELSKKARQAIETP